MEPLFTTLLNVNFDVGDALHLAQLDEEQARLEVQILKNVTLVKQTDRIRSHTVENIHIRSCFRV